MAGNDPKRHMALYCRYLECQQSQSSQRRAPDVSQYQIPKVQPRAGLLHESQAKPSTTLEKSPAGACNGMCVRDFNKAHLISGPWVYLGIDAVNPEQAEEISLGRCCADICLSNCRCTRVDFCSMGIRFFNPQILPGRAKSEI